MKKLAIVFFLFAALSPAQWVTGYYSDQMGLPVSAIPWSKYTHINMFSAAPCQAGNGTVCLHYLVQQDINALVSAARANGKKVLVTIKDNENNNSAFAQSTTSGVLNTFVNNIVAFVNNNGFDGVDLDWEHSVNATQYSNLITALRNAMPNKLITMASGDWGNLPQVASASHSRLDQIHMMCYAMDYVSYIWHHAALTNGGNASRPACDGRIGSHTSRGVPASKISIGIPFYGRLWSGGTQPLASGSSSGAEYNYRNIVGNSTWWQSGNQRFDNTHKADYLAVTSSNQFVTYVGPQAIREIVAWGKARGFGGYMTFAIEKEYLSNQSGDARFPLSTALAREVFPSGSAPVITTSSLPSATVGAAYSQRLSASGTTPITWSIASGVLPTGLSLNSSTGVISGTPSAAVTSTFTVQATNSAGNTSRQFTITVILPVAAPVITATSPLTAVTAGSPCTRTITATGTAPITWSITSGSLPGGLSLNSSNGNITGTPGSAGTYTFTVRVTNAAGSNSRQFSLAVNPASTEPPTDPDPGEDPLPQNQWVLGTYSDQMGMPLSAIPWDKYTHVTMFAAAPCSNANGTVCLHYLLQSDINAFVNAGRAAGKKVLVSLKDNENNLNAFSQNTTSARLSTFVSNIAAFVNNNRFDGIELGWMSNINVTQYSNLITALRNALPGKLIVMSSGEWNNLPQVASASRSKLDQINMLCYNMDYMSYIWHHSAVTQAGDSTKSACDARVASHTNLGIEPKKILIGIPFYGKVWNGGTQPGSAGTDSGSEVTYRSIVENTSWWQQANMRFDNIYKADYLSLSSSNQFVSYVGQQSLREIVAWAKSRGFGGYSTFALEKEYRPGQSGDARYPLSTALNRELTSNGDSGNTAAAPSITSASPLEAAVVGRAYSLTLTASGTAPITWTRTSGSLPAGLTLNSSTGVISGTPAAAGTFTFTVRATNSAGNNSKQFSLTVNAGQVAPSISITSPASGATIMRSQQNVRIRVQTSSSVVAVEYRIDGSTVARVTQAPFSYDWRISNRTNRGWHRIEARATSSSGATATATPIDVRIR